METRLSDLRGTLWRADAQLRELQAEACQLGDLLRLGRLMGWNQKVAEMVMGSLSRSKMGLKFMPRDFESLFRSSNVRVAGDGQERFVEWLRMRLRRIGVVVE